MREDIIFDNQSKPCKSYNQNSRPDSSKSNLNSLKPNLKFGSSWGSQIVKGFTSEKKTKSRVPPANQNKKLPPVVLSSSEISTQNGQNLPLQYQSRVKRSLISEFPCNSNSAQVHPKGFDCNLLRSPASREIFTELDHLREQLRESKERELALQCEILNLRENPRISDLEREIERLNCKINLLEGEKLGLSEQLSALNSIVEENKEKLLMEKNGSPIKNLEVEILELRRLNKELQFQKRNLAIKLSSAESKLAGLTKDVESDIVAKIQAEASLLRHTNANLSKQVEGLQMSRLTEVEELAYLRWINSCLRHELCNNSENNNNSSSNNNKPPHEIIDLKGDFDKLEVLEGEDCKSTDFDETVVPDRRHSLNGSGFEPEPCNNNNIITFIKRRQSDNFVSHREIREEESLNLLDKQKEIPRPCIEKRALRVPNPPPRPSVCSNPNSCPCPNPNPSPCPNPNPNSKPNSSNLKLPPPPPPPPPPPKISSKNVGVMRRAPQVAELYHSLMKRDSRRDSCGGPICESSNNNNNSSSDGADVRSSMIGEIENRSSHLLAIKADVETQGEFVKSLIKDVNGAIYRDIEDVVAFVKWLDDELCFLVDERAVLKHFDWPERKADTLREAAFGYRDLKRLESEVSNYKDDPRLPTDLAFKKMASLSEKMERTVYNLLRTRDSMVRQCKEYSIPTDWILDNGLISKVKFASVKLAKKYMRRVANELQLMGPLNKDPALEYMLLQGVRFAFRIHQFAGGFDAETMDAFEELRNLAHVRNKN